MKGGRLGAHMFDGFHIHILDDCTRLQRFKKKNLKRAVNFFLIFFKIKSIYCPMLIYLLTCLVVTMNNELYITIYFATM